MTTPEPKSGEQFIILQNPTGHWSICNREGCIGSTPHPLMALTIAKNLNHIILDHYNWNRNTQQWKLPIVDPPKVNAVVLIKTISSAATAWLN